MPVSLRAVSAVLLAAALGACGVPSEEPSNEPTQANLDELKVSSRFIVKFREREGQGLAANPGLAAVKAKGAAVLQELGPQNAVAIQATGELVKQLITHPDIEYIERDPVRKPLAQEIPYGIDLVKAPLVWPTATGANRKVCIIDSGLYVAHEDIQDGSVTGSSSGWNTDGCGHGTHVAGTIAALDNGLGVVGVNKSVALHVVKFFNDSCSANFGSSLVDAVNQCRQAGANVISMSLGGSASSETERQAFADAANAGILVVAAAGNAGDTSYSYPASYASVLSVAAVDANKQVASFSQKNDQVDIAAPGVHVESTIPWQDITHLTVNGVSYEAAGIDGAARTDAAGKTGALVDGGLCDKTGSWSGKIVLCQRGTITFADKIKNVQSSGGTGAIIYNNVPGSFVGGTGGTAMSIVAISVSQEDGQTLLGQLGASANIVSQQIKPASGYAAWDGTSMATPHVSGVAALVWSANTRWSAAQIRKALEATAEDLGTAGRDNEYGYGLVNAKAALDYLTSGAGNAKPTVSWSVSCSALNCSFTDASSDSDGSVASYDWNFGDGTAHSTERNPAHAFPATGSYTVTLTVTDNQGATSALAKTVAVDASGANVPPVASFTSSCQALTCTFTSTSTDSDGTIADLTWKFGDGTTGSGAKVSHTYASPGSYSVGLTATDDRGGFGTASKTVVLKISLSASKLALASWWTMIDLSWENATAASIDIYRNGSLYDTVDNSGGYTDSVFFVTGTFKYKVCHAGTTVCSNVVSVTVP